MEKDLGQSNSRNAQDSTNRVRWILRSYHWWKKCRDQLEDQQTRIIGKWIYDKLDSTSSTAFFQINKFRGTMIAIIQHFQI